MHQNTLLLLTLAAMAPVLADKYTINVTNQGFKPSSICIQPKDEIQWYFADPGHSVEETIEVGSCVSKSTWRSTTMSSGWRWSRELKEEGVTSYMSNNGDDCAKGFKGAIYVGSSNCPPDVSKNSSTGGQTPTGSSSDPTTSVSGGQDSRPTNPSSASKHGWLPWTVSMIVGATVALI